MKMDLTSISPTLYQVQTDDDEFDLISFYNKSFLGRIIAMGYPSENVESIYRNSMEDVRRLLEEKHKVTRTWQG